MTTVHSAICRFCAASCPISVEMEDGQPGRVTGNKESPTYHAFCCRRGQALPEVMANPNRLLHSMKRGVDGQHQPINSELAIKEVAAQLREILRQHGPNSIALYFGTQSATYPASAPMAISLMAALQSPMFFTAMTIDQPGKDVAAAMLGGWEAGPHAFADADVWMLVGSNPMVSIHTAMPAQNPGRLITKAIERGMKFIVIDPRRTQTARRAHIHLQPRPGEDATLLAAMIHVIFAERLEDKSFLAENVSGAEALRIAVARFTPAYAAARADVPADQIVDAARLFAGAGRGCAGGSTGANMSGHSTLTEYLILCLNTICGRFLREGDSVANPGVLLSRATPRAQATAPRPARFPDQKFSVRGLTQSAAGMPTAALADEILAGKIRALICLGGNPVSAWPEQDRTIAALREIDLFVTLDPRMSASAKLAHYVMAPKIGLEVPNMSHVIECIELYVGIWTMLEPFGMYAPQLMEVPEGSDLIEEWEFFYGVARHLQLPLKLYYTDAQVGTHREHRDPVDIDMDNKPTTDELYELITQSSRVPLAEVKRHANGAVFHEEIVTEAKDPAYTARLEVGNAEMMTELEEVLTESVKTSTDFPLQLICRRAGHVYNSSGQDLPMLIRKGGRHNPAYVHPDDLAQLGIKDGDVVEISSHHGSILAIAESDETLRPGLVSMTHAFGDLPRDSVDFRKVGSNISRLTSVDDDFDRYSGIPRMSALPVRVLPAETAVTS